MKSTSVLSWIGFGLSITVFLLIWCINILIFNLMGNRANPVEALYMLMLLMGGILGTMALIFSIVGLAMAIKNNTPRWIGTSGIIICVLSILSFFVPIICTGMIKNNAIEIEIPEPPYVSDEIITDEILEETIDENFRADVTIQIFSLGRIRCRNNKSSNSVIGNMDIDDYNFERQLSRWLEMNDVNSSTGILINSTNDADYSDITKVLDALNHYGISNFKLSSSLTSSDYYR